MEDVLSANLARFLQFFNILRNFTTHYLNSFNGSFMDKHLKMGWTCSRQEVDVLLEAYFFLNIITYRVGNMSCSISYPMDHICWEPERDFSDNTTTKH